MGMLSRISAATANRTAEDGLLLVHAMLLMAGANGRLGEVELGAVEALTSTLPEFRRRNVRSVLLDAQAMLAGFPDVHSAVDVLGKLPRQSLRTKAFMLAADIALASGAVDEAEDELLDAMQRVLNVDDQTAQSIIWVLSMKYAH